MPPSIQERDRHDAVARIAIVGCGEVGRTYAAALAPLTGQRLELCDPHPGTAAIELAGRLGVPIHGAPGPWLVGVGLVIACVPGSVSLETARAIFPHLGRSIYVDFSTAAPAAKRLAEKEAKTSGKGIRFVDVVIMSAIARAGAAAPLVCAGDGAEVVRDLMARVGATVRILPDASVGDAAALKLLRSIFAKGLEALAVECLVAAEAMGMREQLYEALSDFDAAPLREHLEVLVRTHLVHARRRMHEVAEAEEQLHASGLPVFLLPAIRGLFAETCAAKEATPVGSSDPNIEEALQWLLRIRRAAGKGPSTPPSAQSGPSR